MTLRFTPDPKLDLVLERVVDVPPELVWAAWTQPEHLKEWFCPKPWRTTHVEMDLRPGGRFDFVMEGPEGERNENFACYLEVTPNRRLVWTTALWEGYRPAAVESSVPFLMTAVVEFEPHPKGAKYRAIALHKGTSEREQHEKMGFAEGWGAALDQLVAHAKTMKK